jgi:8-oxo-dGTP pyrophosphatase MutT (NUDIX family)
MSKTTDQRNAVLRALRGETTASSDFDLNPDVVLPENRILRPAGVLIGLVDGVDGLDVILTKRSSRLKHHPGQIAFPGGKQEESDADVIAAALREAEEEVGLPQHAVEILGTLPPHETITNFLMTPVVALVKGPFLAIPEPGEVDEVFAVPLAHVCDPAQFSVQFRRWRGMRRSYFTVPYGPYYIWGATARVLRGLADRMTS